MRPQWKAALTAAALFAPLISTVTAHASDATTYFVSASQGNDANSGTSAAHPWRTFDPVNALTLHPGDRVLLKSGDTWTGQELDPKGSGTPESPIVISSYGPGSRPHIAPGIGVKTYAIHLVDNGGYDISNLEISDTYGGVVAYDNKTYGHRYLHVTNSVFHDITGKDTGFVIQPTDPSPGGSPTPDLYFGTAVSVSGYTDGPTLYSDIRLDHDTFYRDDAAFDQVQRGPAYNRAVWRDLAITNSRIYDMYRTGGIVTYDTTNVLIDHVRLYQAAGYDNVGMFWGDAAIQVVQSENVTVQNSEMIHSRRTFQLQDVGEVDFEGMNINAKLLNSYVANSDGEAVEIYVGWGGPSTGTVVDGDRLDFNHGCCDDLGNPAEDVFLVYGGNDGQISNTTIRLRAPDQSYDPQLWYQNDVVLEPSSIVYAPGDQQVFGATHPTADLSTRVVRTGRADVVTVHNNGPSPAPNTTLSLAPATTDGAATSVQTTAGYCWLPLLDDNGSTNCLLGTLKPGQTAVVTTLAKSGVSSYPTATATVSSGVADPDQSNNSSNG